MMTAVWKAPIAQKAQKISNGYLAVGDCVFDVPYDKVKNRRCKKKRNKARGFPQYGSPRALIYHTAKKNYLILKKRV